MTEPASESEPIWRQRRLFGADDKVTELLMLHVATHVKYETLELLATYLGLPGYKFGDAKGVHPENPRLQKFYVSL